jgi:hypothetical protein
MVTIIIWKTSPADSLYWEYQAAQPAGLYNMLARCTLILQDQIRPKPQAPNAANADESKATAYTALPNPSY